jgi:hypothetical protein
MKPKVPCRREPSAAMYVPWMARMSVSRLYRAPSLPMALPAWNATAVVPV